MHLRTALMAITLVASPYMVSAEPLDPTEGYIETRGIVGGFTTDSEGHHSVNGYWIVGDDGLVLIDAHWRLSDARRALEALRSNTDLPIAALLLTHAHSDHYGGLPVFLDAAGGQARYFASVWTARSIRHDEQGFRANRRDQFGEDFPAAFPEPTDIIRDGEAIEVAGVTIVPYILRQNEAFETVIFHLPSDKALFTADLVNHDTLPVLYQGGLDSWIDQLRSLRSRFPDVEIIYPGHGAPGDPETLIDAEIAVLEAHRDLIAEALEDDGAVDPTERDAIKDEIEAHFPDWRTTAGMPSRRLVIEQNITWTLRGWRVASETGGNAREFRADAEE